MSTRHKTTFGRHFLTQTINWGVFRRLSVLLSGTMISRIFAASSFILMARAIGPAALGQFASTLTIVRLSSLLFTLGMDHWLLRNGGHSHHPLSESTTSILVLKVVLGIPWFFLLSLLMPAVNPKLFAPEVIHLVALVVWGEEIINTIITGFQTDANVRLAAIVTVLPQGLILAGTALVAVVSSSLTTQLTMRATIMIVYALLVVALWGGTYGFKLAPTQMITLPRAASPFAVSSFLVILYGTADIVLVGQLLGSEAAGLYSPASMLIGLFFLVPTAYFTVMVPVLSREYARDSADLTRHNSNYICASILLGGLLATGMVVISPFFVSLAYGSAYFNTIELLPVLSAVVWLHTIAFSLAAILTSIDLQRQRLIPQAAAAMLNISLNFLLLPRFGLIAVAWSYVASELVLVGGYWIIYHKASEQFGDKKRAVAQ